MTVIQLVPKTVESFATLNQKARVTFSKQLVTFNPAAVKKLALKQGDYVRFEVDKDTGKLYFVQDVKSQGFQLNNQSKYGALSAGAKGLLAALYSNKIVPELKTARFEVQDFKDGRNELMLIEKKS